MIRKKIREARAKERVTIKLHPSACVCSHCFSVSDYDDFIDFVLSK